MPEETSQGDQEIKRPEKTKTYFGSSSVVVWPLDLSISL
jgi:hypothetical protein